MYTDAWFLHAMDEAVQLHLEHVPAPTYVYYFDHRGVASFSQVFGDPHNDYGMYFIFKYLITNIFKSFITKVILICVKFYNIAM